MFCDSPQNPDLGWVLEWARGLWGTKAQGVSDKNTGRATVTLR